MAILKKIMVFSLAVILAACEQDKPKPVIVEPPVVEVPKIPEIKFTVANQYPHDITSFTEGFYFNDGKLFESTGSPDNVPYAKSVFGSVDMKTGKIDVKAELDKTIYFGEGSVYLNGKIFQLTYKNQTGFIYDGKTYKNIGQFTYTNREGWGLTTDGKSLIMSDGTSYLTFIDPVSFTSTKTLDVAENDRVLEYLNELEYIKGFIYANVWMTNTIVKIDPNTGNVVGKMDLSSLSYESKTRNSTALEMNGIAYDSISGKVLVTGKLWPTMYEIKFPF
ncbi:MAG: glutaminyl-peptide cyclotransferase [Bacteroidota bacterium]